MADRIVAYTEKKAKAALSALYSEDREALEAWIACKTQEAREAGLAAGKKEARLAAWKVVAAGEARRFLAELVISVLVAIGAGWGVSIYAKNKAMAALPDCAEHSCPVRFVRQKNLVDGTWTCWERGSDMEICFEEVK